MRISIPDPLRDAFPLYDQACTAIDPLIAQLCRPSVAAEGFGDNFVTRALIAVFDTVLGITTSLTMNLTRITKKLKRSEMHEFYNSNLLKCKSVNMNLPVHLNDTKVSNIKLNAPAGLATSMKEAVDTLNLIYNQLDAVTTAKATLSTLQNVFKSFSEDGSNASPAITDSARFIQTIVRTSKPTVMKCQKEYKSNKIDNFGYYQLYTDASGVGDVTQSLLNMEPRLQEVHQLVELVKQIESVLKGLVQMVKDEKTVKVITKDIVTLGEVAKGISLIFDSFALAATRQMALEHNHILNINALYKAMA